MHISKFVLPVLSACVSIIAAALPAVAQSAPACGDLTPENVTLTWSGSSGCHPGVTCDPQAIAFSAVGSGYDFACGGHAYTWDMGDGSALSYAAAPVHIFPVLPGTQTYFVQLTVTNGRSTLVTGRPITFHTSPTATTQPRINSFNADVARTMRGQPITLSWDVDFAYEIRIDPIAYTTSTARGDYTFVPTGSGTYTLTAYGTAGLAGRSAIVEVVDTPCSSPPPNVSIDWFGTSSGCTRSNGVSCHEGESVRFSVQPFGNTVPGCYYDFQWHFGDGSSSTRQNPAHSFIGIGTFTASLSARNAAGAAADSTKLLVAATTLSAIALFTATPANVTRGNPVTIQWTVRNATGILISPLNVRTNLLEGTYVFTPSASTTLQMTAFGNAAAAAASTQVTVLDGQPRRRAARH